MKQISFNQEIEFLYQEVQHMPCTTKTSIFLSDYILLSKISYCLVFIDLILYTFMAEWKGKFTE